MKVQRSPRCLWLAAMLYAAYISPRLPDAFSLLTASKPSSRSKGQSTPGEAEIRALEKTWKPNLARDGSGMPGVSSLRQLAGTWLLSSPKENAPKGLMSGDVPRMLLNLYAGDIGRMLSMELVTEPTLQIATNGRSFTRTSLRWGPQEDEVTLEGNLELIAPNVLRENPKLTRSKALKFTLPAMQQPRVMNITYFDGNLLIVRDARGIVDVLRREEPLPRPSVRVRQEPPPGPPPKKAATPSEQVHGLLEEVHSLSSSLEALRNQTNEDQQARQQLAKEIDRLEKELDTATNNARADEVILKALETVNTKVSGLFEVQAEKTQEKTRTYEELQEEMDGLTSRMLDMEENITRYRVREGNLQKQIRALQSERAAGDAFRTAMQQAKGELKTVRQDLHTATKDVARLREEARGRSYMLERAEKLATNQVKVRMKIEEELQDQKFARSEAQERLSQAAVVEKELREELANLKSEFETLQQREVRAREIAAGMEAEIDKLLSEAKTAQKTLQESGLDSKKKRRFWPFR